MLALAENAEEEEEEEGREKLAMAGARGGSLGRVEVVPEAAEAGGVVVVAGGGLSVARASVGRMRLREPLD